MRSISPRPVIVRNHKTWSITPGMSYTVSEDVNGIIWVAESCPAGTQFWTPEQVEMLSGGERTGDPIEAAATYGKQLQMKLKDRPVSRRQSIKIGLPASSPSKSAIRKREMSQGTRISDRELARA